MMTTELTIHWVDYLIVCLTLAICLGIGIFFGIKGRRRSTRTAYFMGDRKLGIVPVCLSLFVTFMSAVSLLGIPAEMYFYGSGFFIFLLSLGICYVISIYTLIPLMYPLEVTSMYEYLGLRFESTAVRLLGTCVGMLQTISYMAICLLSPALALQSAAGIELWLSVVVIGIVGTVYTSLGGIKSVVWTDTFQAVLMFTGIITILVKALMEVGGVMKMFEIANSQGRIIFDDVRVDPRIRQTVWSLTIGAFFSWLLISFNQSTVQRLSSLRTMRAAKIAFLLNGPLIIVYGSILCFTGILVYSYFYSKACDPYKAGLIKNRNQVMPYFVMQVLAELPGMTGLYISTLFSASLSTFSSGINALAANTAEDLLGYPFAKFKVKESTATHITKLLVLFYGMLAIGLAYLAKSLHGPVTQMANSVMGACGGPVLGIFLLGAIFPWANKHGALYGCLAAIIFNMWMAIGGQIYGSPPVPLPPAPTYGCAANHTSVLINVTGSQEYSVSTSNTVSPNTNLSSPTSEEGPLFIYQVSYLWYGLSGVVISMTIGSILSLVTGKYDVTLLDPRLLFPFARRIWKIKLRETSDGENTLKLEQSSLMNVRESWKKEKEDRFPSRSSFIVPGDGNDLNIDLHGEEDSAI
ncbi:sodium-coupled monocarboxylate transporter 2-like [Gigantopelta aegis]|uniref:sodium-coupled monocarboxylate transporter 2-like n=1 Tax=Gigantopelta aegis TaxID=1735272 RepID=UPI001B887FA2|nr:sodium-coupled monocarboxylate transporter 2-like [Gigantopelta aegis]